MCVAISFLMTFVYVYTMEPIQCNLLWNWVNCAVAISSPQSSLCRPGWHLAIALLLVDVWQSTCQDAIEYCNQKSPCWLWSNGIKLFTYFNHTGWQAIDWIVVDVVTRLCNLSLSWDMFELSTWWWSELTCWNCWHLVAITHQWEWYQALQAKATMLTMTMIVVEHVPIYFKLICFGKTRFGVLFKTREVESWKWKSCRDFVLDFGRTRNAPEM